MKELLERLIEEFSDREYAHAYMESHAVSRLAAQIHAIRKQRGWSQDKLSKQSGIAQERISKIESADFSSLTMNTLQKFSRAFDVNLRVAFEPFSQGILDIVNLARNHLEVESRPDDLAQFSKRTMKIDREGKWQAFDPKSMAAVSSIHMPVSKSVTPSGAWQDLSSLEIPGVPTHHKVA